MKITVDRNVNTDKNLVFTITVNEPHISSFGDTESHIMSLLEDCMEKIYGFATKENKCQNDVVDLIHSAKEKTFVRVLNNLKFAIDNELCTMFKPICQEIYNWIYDYQTDNLKTWMTQFDAQRTKYYFSNDLKKDVMVTDPLKISDDKIDEDDEDE